MLDTKFCGNRPAGSDKEKFQGFYRILALRPSWPCGQHYFKKKNHYHVPESYIQNLVLNGSVVSEKGMF